MYTLEKRGSIFILTLTGPDAEHRLNPTAIDSIKSALSTVKSQATPGSVLITTAHGKFFSNGFDLKWAQQPGSPSGFQARLHHMVDYFKPVVADLLSLPMPTIAAVTGHAAAAGMLLAISHDYVVMRGDRGVMYMSELDIGMTFPEYFTAMFRSKIGKVGARRDVMLAAKKVKAGDAVEMGLVDLVCEDGEKTVDAAVRMAEELGRKMWNGEIYAEIRKAMYPEICGVLSLTSKPIVAPRL
uniref:Delta(3)-Delta(2)-enoyl-CoA isomerase n=1 Tax=Kalanchoe fedtschenkoi TaxID=63787 RepID=A0A7N0URE2_KALFE